MSDAELVVQLRALALRLDGLYDHLAPATLLNEAANRLLALRRREVEEFRAEELMT